MVRGRSVCLGGEARLVARAPVLWKRARWITLESPVDDLVACRRDHRGKRTQLRVVNDDRAVRSEDSLADATADLHLGTLADSRKGAALSHLYFHLLARVGTGQDELADFLAQTRLL